MNTFVRTVLVMSIAVATSPSIAQETSEAPKDNQTLLQKLEQKVNQYSTSVKEDEAKVSVPVINQNSSVVSELPVIPRNEVIAIDPMVASDQPDVIAPNNEVEEKGSLEVMIDTNLMMPLRELPTGSRFTFDKTVFFPANTVSLLYSNGSPVGKVYEGGDPLDNILSMTDIDHSACAMISDKSYIKFRGNDSSTNPTFIDFDKLEYIKDGESNRIVYRLNFQPKSAGEHSVTVSMACVLPADKNEQVSSLEMRHIVEAFGQSFTFEPPKYVEL